MNKNGKTILITGSSSGIGLETALYFHERGWNVVATMRQPGQRSTPLHDKGLDLVHLDVMDAESIQAALHHTLDKYGRIDVLVNNAGYAVYGPFEATDPDQIKSQFDTNLFGLMAVTRALLPVFREQRDGVIINLSSVGGRSGFPLYTVYNSSKWAVEGFTEALQYELRPFNIRVKLIEPGVIRTNFYGRSMQHVKGSAVTDTYAGIIRRNSKNVGEEISRSSADPQVVAKTIYRVAADSSWRIHYPVGMDARMILLLRWLLPQKILYRLLERILL